MSKVFLIRKNIVLSMLVALMTVSSITTVTAAEGIDKVMNANQNLNITYVEAVSNTSTTAEVNNLVLSSTPANINAKRPNNFLEFSIGLEALTDTKVNQDGTLDGPLYNILTADSYDMVGGNHQLHLEHRDNPTYLEAMSNNVLIPLFNEKSSEVTALCNKTFTDVANDGNGWYKKALSGCVYYGVISGVGNNNFAPQKVLTVQEWAIMLGKATQGADGLSQNKDSFTYKQIVKTGINDWAVSGVVTSNSYLPKIYLFRNAKSVYEAGIPRIFTVDSIVQFLYKSEVSADSVYYNKAKKGVSVSPFSDIKKVISEDSLYELANKNSTTYDEERYKVIQSRDGSIDEESYRSLLCAYEKGLISGKGAGLSGYADSLTRAEAVQFLENFARANYQTLK